MGKRRTFAKVRSEVLHVPMRDGVRLSVHVHRPDEPGRFPAILGYTPYRKGPLRGPDPIVHHGYATASFDIRGTGNSEGCNDSIYSDAERQDGYDMVEWAARQPWCDGNVGMWGISFGAVAAIQTAMAAPPHLKAIIARSGSDDPYTEWTNPGGSPRPYLYTCYGPLMTALNFLPPDPEEVGERWSEIWQQRLEGNVPWGIPFIRNLLDGPFWRARSLRGKYENVTCAVFVVDGWADWYHSALLRIYSQIRSPKRAMIGPWSHNWPHAAVPGPRIDWPREALRWFDRWLKGIDNGIAQEPPVTIFVRQYQPPDTILLEDKGVFRGENAWPIARAVETPMYLRGKGALAAEPPQSAAESGSDAHVYDPRIGACAGFHGGGPFNDNWAMPLDQRPDEALSLVYTTEPLSADVEVTGQPRARLHVSSTADVALFCVKLCDVAPDGTSALVTKGWLNVTHRKSHARPAAIQPGKVYPIDVELLTCAYRFLKGHRIRVTVASSDLMNVWPTPQACVNTIYRSAERPSHVVLPVAPPQRPRLRKPAPGPSTSRRTSGPTRAEMEAPSLSVTSDPINRTSTVAYVVRYGGLATQEASYTVSAAHPAQVVARSRTTAGANCAGKKIEVVAHAVTASDEQAFHHTVDVHIAIDGQPHLSKSWSVSVPRRLM